MKLELDMWRQLLDLYTKFKLSISKDAEKIPKYLKKFKTHKNNRQSSENKIFA